MSLWPWPFLLSPLLRQGNPFSAFESADNGLDELDKDISCERMQPCARTHGFVSRCRLDFGLHLPPRLVPLCSVQTHNQQSDSESIGFDSRYVLLFTTLDSCLFYGQGRFGVIL